MKIIYLGTPDFALIPLEYLHASRHEILAVVTQPDRLGNRNRLTPPPVKVRAIELGYRVLQYEKISREGVAELTALNADIMITCAFGQILSQNILDICSHGVINIHASLLPKYRGSCPIHWAIINGDKEAGVTIMQTAREVDSGDIINVAKTVILQDETTGELFDRLSELGARTIVETLDMIEAGSACRCPQNHKDATHCEMLSKSDGLINFDKSYKQIDCFVRGMSPWPSAFINIDNQIVKVFRVKERLIDKASKELKIGSIIHKDRQDGLVIKCKSGGVEIVELQFSGGKRMTAVEYLLGHRISDDAIKGE